MFLVQDLTVDAPCHTIFWLDSRASLADTN